MSANGFIRIERELWHSPEVAALSPLARLILVELHYHYTGRNNGSISLPQKLIVEQYRCSYSSVKRAFRELHNAGFIKTVVHGSFDHKDGARKGTCNQYRLTCI